MNLSKIHTYTNKWNSTNNKKGYKQRINNQKNERKIKSCKTLNIHKYMSLTHTTKQTNKQWEKTQPITPQKKPYGIKIKKKRAKQCECSFHCLLFFYCCISSSKSHTHTHTYVSTIPNFTNKNKTKPIKYDTNSI